MQKNARWKGRLAVLVIVLALAAYVSWALLRPLPPLQNTSSAGKLSIAAPASALAWPASTQAAVSLLNSQVIETRGTQKPAPTASTAKIITALVVLKQKPLSVGQLGPTIILSANDQAIYNNYSAQSGSVVPVQAGEQISEYQMLEAMLLPSANNMADSLAIWAYGSLPAYSAAANTYLKQLGINNTTVGSDASGFSPTTLSTAEDLVRLGVLVLNNPVLAGVVGQTSVNGIPIAGTVKNVNFLLGNSGINGIKTGNTDQAGGVFVASAKATVQHQPVTIVTAVINVPTLFQAMKSSLTLVQSAETNFKSVEIVKAGDIIGAYRMPWGGSIPAVASANLNALAWKGSNVNATIKLDNNLKADASSGTVVGSIQTGGTTLSREQSVPVKIKSSATKPTITWRLTHPFVINGG